MFNKGEFRNKINIIPFKLTEDILENVYFICNISLKHDNIQQENKINNILQMCLLRLRFMKQELKDVLPHQALLILLSQKVAQPIQHFVHSPSMNSFDALIELERR